MALQALFLVLALLRAPSPAVAAAPEPIRLSVFHTNDVHGWIMPRAAFWNEADPKRVIVGAAALASYLKRQSGPRLLLDAGDWFQGTPEGNLTRGRSVVAAFNA